MRRFTLLAAVTLTGCLVSTRPPPRRGGGPPPPPSSEPAPRPPGHHGDHHHEEPPPGPRAAFLTGIVVDAATRKPLDRAAVDVNSPVLPKNLTVQTDAEGRYTTEAIPPGDFVVRVRRSGYETQEQRLRVGDATATLDFALAPLRR